MAVRLSPASARTSLQRRLDVAGNPERWTPDRVLASKALCLVVLGVIGALLGVKHPDLVAVTGGAGAAVGFFLPDVLLYNAGLKRQQQLAISLPEGLDLLTICVEAGLGFDAAVAQVARNLNGPLAAEFARLLQEMQIGKSRAEAMRAMAERTNVPEAAHVRLGPDPVRRARDPRRQRPARASQGNARAAPSASRSASPEGAGEDHLPADRLPAPSSLRRRPRGRRHRDLSYALSPWQIGGVVAVPFGRLRLDVGRLIMVPVFAVDVAADVVSLGHGAHTAGAGVLRSVGTVLMLAFYTLAIWCYLRRGPAVATSGSLSAHAAAIAGTWLPFAFPLLPGAPSGPGREALADVLLICGLAWAALVPALPRPQHLHARPGARHRHQGTVPLGASSAVPRRTRGVARHRHRSQQLRWPSRSGLPCAACRPTGRSGRSRCCSQALPAYRAYRSRTAALLPGVF